MSLIENIGTIIILVTYPMFIYLLYIAHKKNIKQDKNNLILSACLFASLFLSLSFYKHLNNELYFIICATPILIAYLNNKKITAIIMSLIILDYCYWYTNVNIVFITILLLTYYISYNIYSRTTWKSRTFSNLFAILTIIAFLFTNINTIENNLYAIIEYNIIIVLYYLTVILIDFLLIKGKETLNLYMTLKEFEREKQIKISLFKITHEIKNPIAVIKGYIDMFDTSDKAKSKRYIKIIKGEINRTLNLLGDFMDFTKINLEKNSFDFNLLIDDIKNLTIPLLESKKINYDFKTEPNLSIKADFNRLKQVLLNIVKNAIEASKKNNGFVSITVFKDEHYMFITVKDNGIGMSKETLQKIFTPFFTTKSNGTGLGVCLSKEIIEAHKGTITYNSIENKETIVKVVLPIN